jgi:hypothetical protein
VICDERRWVCLGKSMENRLGNVGKAHVKVICQGRLFVLWVAIVDDIGPFGDKAHYGRGAAALNIQSIFLTGIQYL